MIKNKNISIFGSYSGYNKGDLAILISIINNFYKINEDLTFFVSSKKPKEISKYIKNKNVKIYKSLTAYIGFKTLTFLKKSDVLFFGGGGLFFDKKYCNPFYNHIINLFFITLVNKLFFKKKIFLISVGASHLNKYLPLRMTKFILNNSDYITVRDYSTYSLFTKMTNKKIYVNYDPAFLLNKKQNNSIDNFIGLLNKNNKKIIISINNSIFKNNQNQLNSLINLINIFQKKYSVVLCNNTTKVNSVKKLFSLCKKDNLKIFNVKKLSPEEIIYLYNQFNFVISFPMHSAILAYNAKTNLITVNYDNKVKDFNKIIKNSNHVNFSELNKLKCFVDSYKEIKRSKTIKKEIIKGFKKIRGEL